MMPDILEQASTALQLQMHQLRLSNETELTAAKAEAKAREAEIYDQAKKAAQAGVADQLAAIEKPLLEARAKREEAEGKLAKLSEQFEHSLNDRLRSEREILEKAKEDAVNLEKAKAFEETQKLSNKVADLQRALDNKTVAELGEGAEVNLFEALRAL